jgi:hypothetical protein
MLIMQFDGIVQEVEISQYIYIHRRATKRVSYGN